MSLILREAAASDLDAVRELFVAVYGDSYGHPEFYDTEWLTRFIYDDDSLFLVGEDRGRIVGSASALLSIGDADDLIALLGRFVVHPECQGQGVGKAIARERIARIQERAHFAFGEVRTVHDSNQRIYESAGFAPVGFQPMNFVCATRESEVVYARLFGDAARLRRNHPRVIPEVMRLANTVLPWMGCEPDAVTLDEDEGWPIERSFPLERLEASSLPPLLRIARGRVSHREVFGKLSLAMGSFLMAAHRARYIVARDGDVVVGGVGLMFDAHARRVRIFELIAEAPAIKGALLAEADRVAREELGAAYLEIDVSAYSPSIQRTLQRLGFTPVAYLPAMVFEQVERLDVVRMAKLMLPYDPGPLRLLSRPQRILEVVEHGLDQQHAVALADEVTRRALLFDRLNDGDRAQLARLAVLRSYPAGTLLMREGDVATNLCVLVDGAADALSADRKLRSIAPGETIGEIALVERTVRTASVKITRDARVLELALDRLEALMARHPRLGMAILSNLARGLSQKLRG